MNAAEKIYVSLCALFAVLIVTGNLTYQKFVHFSPFSLHTLELSVGTLLYPLTFILTDLITECYGKEKAKFCVKLAISLNIIMALVIGGLDKLDATPWSTINNSVFHKVFGGYSIAFTASIIACYFTQLIDIAIYLGIYHLTHGKYLWLRSNVSTAISLLADTFIINSLIAVFGALPKEHVTTIILNSYLFKIMFTLGFTPLFYLNVKLIKSHLIKVKDVNLFTINNP